MKSVNIKSILIISALMVAISLFGCVKNHQFQPVDNNQMKGQVNYIRYGDIAVHSYTAPDNAAQVTTQIIETPNELVIVDVQFLLPMAEEVAGYIKMIGKPVNRVLISHDHPDHWFGVEHFRQYPVYALQETIDGIQKTGDFFIQMRNKKDPHNVFPDQKTIPENVLKTGKETIDGVTFIFDKITTPAESSSQLIVKIPEIETIIVQDFVYNKCHAYLGQNAIDGWIDVLNELEKETAYKSVLVGHGIPDSSGTAYKDMKTYLYDVKTFRTESDTPDQMIASLIRKYPDYGIKAILNMSVPMLYKKGH